MADMFSPGRWRFWHRIVVAMVATAAAWLATYALIPELRTDAPVIFFPLAVVCSAYVAGPIGGLICTGLSSLVAAYFFLPPEGFGVTDLPDQIRLIVFIFLGGAVSLFSQALQRSRMRIQAKSQALRETQEHLGMATEAADVGTWDWDIADDKMIWSDRCKILFGLSPAAQVSIGTFAGTVHPEDRALTEEARKRALADRTEYDIEFRIVRPDGGIRWILTKGRGLYDRQGRAVRMHGIAMDITERKRVLEQLQLLNETLEQRVADRTAVARKRTHQVQTLACELAQAEQRERRRLAEILHDHLQQLLVGARFSVNLLQSRLQGPDLLEPVHQIDDLILQSLEVSRTLTAELNPPVLNEQGLVKGLQWLAGWMRDKHGLRVAVRADEQVGRQSREITLLLFQSVRELLLNIVKHARVETATVTISQSHDDHIRIVVEDRGAGFDPGQPVTKPGSGFGLNSVRERLALLDGHLGVCSKPGEGTRITLEAPIKTTDTVTS